MNITYGTGSCRGWTDPKGYPTLIPTIDYLNQWTQQDYYSPAGATTLVVIFGKNYRPFTKILFGTTNPPTIYISSTQIEFYVPTSLLPGIYPIQVFNDTLASNVVLYTLDNSSGYWLLQGNQITNTNTFGVNVKANATNAAASSPQPQLVISSYQKSGVDTIDLSYNLNFITTAKANTVNVTTQEGDALIYTNFKSGSALKPCGLNITFPQDPTNNSDSATLPKGVRFAPGQTVVYGDLIVYGKILSKSHPNYLTGGQIIAENQFISPNVLLNDPSSNPIYDPATYNPPFPYLPSDYRIKDVLGNIESMNECVVDHLNPIKYLNKQNGHTEIGFLAHEVQKEMPYLVTGTMDGPETQTLNYIGLIGVLVKEVKELKKEIAYLKEKERQKEN